MITTLEGLVGDEKREDEYAVLPPATKSIAKKVDERTLSNCDAVIKESRHVIAISPFLGRMGRAKWGEKVSVLPLGIDRRIYYSLPDRLRKA